MKTVTVYADEIGRLYHFEGYTSTIFEDQAGIRQLLHKAGIRQISAQGLYTIELNQEIEVGYQSCNTNGHWVNCDKDRYDFGIRWTERYPDKESRVRIVARLKPELNSISEEKSCQWNCVKGYCLSSEAKHNEHQCNYNNGLKKLSEEQEEKSESQEERKAKEDKLWYEFLYDVGSNRHLLNGETEPERWEEMRSRLQEKWNIQFTRKGNTL